MAAPPSESAPKRPKYDKDKREERLVAIEEELRAILNDVTCKQKPERTIGHVSRLLKK